MSSQNPPLACNKCWKANSLTQMVITHSCYHVFCTSCAEQWFSSHDECPMCRKPLEDKTTQLKLIVTNASDKAHHLYGQPPQKINEIAAMACNFWDYQRRLYIQKQMEGSTNTVSRSMYEEQSRSKDAEHEQRLLLQREVDSYKDRVSQLEQRLQDKENRHSNTHNSSGNFQIYQGNDDDDISERFVLPGQKTAYKRKEPSTSTNEQVPFQYASSHTPTPRFVAPTPKMYTPRSMNTPQQQAQPSSQRPYSANAAPTTPSRGQFSTSRPTKSNFFK